MLNFESYKSTLQYPDKPRGPVLYGFPHPTADQAQKYADDMRAYEAAMSLYNAEVKKVREDEGRLVQQFRDDLLEDLGVTGHPKADLLYSKAWERGHSAGLYEVYSVAQDLVELIL